jgi:hypothetical protein
MVLKFSQQMKHAQSTEKYIRLIFNSYEEIGQNILVITIFLTTRYIHMLLIHYKIKGTVILPRVAIHAIPPFKFYNTVYRYENANKTQHI